MNGAPNDEPERYTVSDVLNDKLEHSTVSDTKKDELEQYKLNKALYDDQNHCIVYNDCK